MESMETQVKRMEARMVDWGHKLQHLAAKADEAGSSANEGYRLGIAELSAKHQAAQAELRNARKAGSKAWSNFKTKLDTACAELEKTLNEFTQPGAD